MHSFQRASACSAGDAAGSHTAASRYRALEAARAPYLERARDSAALTTPTLMPPDSLGPANAPKTPYQGVGARGVNNLANKLLLAQFPPNMAFFRLIADDGVMREAQAARMDDGARLSAEVESALQRIERDIMREIETGFFRAGLHAALRQLVVSGNVLLHTPPEGGLRVFRLDRYVIRRNPMGDVIEIIVKESAPIDSLPDDVQAIANMAAGRFEDHGTPRYVDLYTWIRRDRDGWSAHQEVADTVLAHTTGRYADGALDWMALRWSHVDGEDYGRSHVEELLGDLRSLEGLMQAIVEGAAVASKMTVLVSPNGQTDAEALAEAENGAIIDGEAGDVAILQTGKMQDFSVAFESVRVLTERLGFAFLLNSTLRKDSGRATATEIQFVAAELEDALGGVYSVLAEELQQPLVEALLSHKAARNELPALPKGVLRPMIVTGLDALGRNHDLEKLRKFVGFIGELSAITQSPIGAVIDIEAVLLQVGAAIGVETNNFIHPTARGGANRLAFQPAAATKDQSTSNPSVTQIAKMISPQMLANMHAAVAATTPQDVEMSSSS